jgi:hypothetical protein
VASESRQAAQFPGAPVAQDKAEVATGARSAERPGAPAAPPGTGAPARARTAAPETGGLLQKTAIEPDVVGRLVVTDPAATRRAVAVLAPRLGGREVAAAAGGETGVVEIVVPRRAWDDLVRELGRLGRFTPERQPPDLPADVRVAIRLEQGR